MIPSADYSRVTGLSMQVRKLCQISAQPGFDSCLYQVLRPRSQQIRQRIRDPVSTVKINTVSRFHGGVSPLVGLLSCNNTSTRYTANFQTTQIQDTVIARLYKHLGPRKDQT